MEKIKNTSWKTTLAGAVSALGIYFSEIQNPDPVWLNTIGSILPAGGGFLIGLWARDNNKSSEDVGASE